MRISEDVVVALIGALSTIIGSAISVVAIQFQFSRQLKQEIDPAEQNGRVKLHFSGRSIIFGIIILLFATVVGLILLALTPSQFAPRAYPHPHTQINRTETVFDQVVPAGEIYCLIGGDMTIPELSISLDGDEHGSVVCWIGKQKALAVEITDDQSLAQIAFQDFDPLDVANFWAQHWAQRRVLGPDGCGINLCQTVDVVLIEPNQHSSQFVVVKPV